MGVQRTLISTNNVSDMILCKYCGALHLMSPALMMFYKYFGALHLGYNN